MADQDRAKSSTDDGSRHAGADDSGEPAASRSVEVVDQPTAVGGSGSSPETRPAITIAEVQQLVSGALSVHFVNRDVMLRVDGDTAVRLLALWQGRRDWQDSIDPADVSADRIWIGLDLNRVMGISWVPDIASHSIGMVGSLPHIES